MNLFSNYLNYQLDQLLKPAREALAKERASAVEWDSPDHESHRQKYLAAVIDIAAKTNLRLSDIDRYLREEQHGDS